MHRNGGDGTGMSQRLAFKAGHNNLEDVKRLQQHVEGMQFTSSAWDSCQECLLNKAKKEAVSKDVSTRAQQKC